MPAIDFTPFFQVEERMRENDEKHNDLLLTRLEHLSTEEPEAPAECRRDLMSLDEIKKYIEDEYERGAPFTDIPHVTKMEYADDELEFWAALIADYRQMISRVPKYANIMIWSGIPPALRGLVWRSMCESYSTCFESLYDSLAQEWTPFVKLIGRDLNRTFPEISLFEEKGGEGQKKLGRVLRAYSAYDMQVGYCQGLTFLAGPLLLHMSDRDAFCVLIKLMEDYNLRSMFTPDMAGLQLRIYQFERLFGDYLPELKAHFDELGVTPIYATQWFLSFFAVTCPLTMLVRIYDVMFAEGAIETLMRVALAVLKRNANILLEFDHDEEVLQHLLGRSLWDKYGYDSNVLLGDVTSVNATLLEKMKYYEQQYFSAPKLSRTLSKRTNNPPKKSSSGEENTSKFNFGWSMPWNNASPSNASTSTLSRSDSVHSFSSDETAATSVTSYEPSSHEKKIQELEALLAQERREREQDKHAVESLVTTLEGVDSAELSQVKTRFGLGDESASTAACKSCEGYLMDLATARSNEAMARQELDEMADKYEQLMAQLSSTTISSSTNPSMNTTPTKPTHSPKKSSWSLW